LGYLAFAAEAALVTIGLNLHGLWFDLHPGGDTAPLDAVTVAPVFDFFDTLVGTVCENFYD